MAGLQITRKKTEIFDQRCPISQRSTRLLLQQKLLIKLTEKYWPSPLINRESLMKVGDVLKHKLDIKLSPSEAQVRWETWLALPFMQCKVK